MSRRERGPGMKINALAPWFGAKRTLAPEIVRQLGPHRAYWEPFCGSMAILLWKPPCTMETVNDLHCDLVNLAQVIRDDQLGPKLYRRLRRTLCAEQIFREEAAEVTTERVYTCSNRPDLDRAYSYFLVSWLGINGVAGTAAYNSNFAARFTAKGGSQNKRWANVIQSIPQWRARLRNVAILNRCGLELCEHIADEPGAVIYADPPYLHETRSMKAPGLRPKSLYVHDFSPDDHHRLAAALRRFRLTRVVVSYYSHPLLADLYHGWSALNCTVAKSLVQSRLRDKRGKVTAPEVLLVNGPLIQEEASLFA